MSNISKPLVSVLMPCYNHDKFVAKAINSFLSQKTSFPIELVICDDASTDLSLEVITQFASHPNIKIFKKEKNEGLLYNYKFLLENVQGKYIAILESDDYWLTTDKLQKQIEFLEQHEGYGLVFTDCERVDENDSCISQYICNVQDFSFSSLFKECYIPALTVCFRKSSFDKYCNIDDYICNHFLTFDYPTWLQLSIHTKIFYLPEISAAYRVLSTSISNDTSYEKQFLFTYSTLLIKNYCLTKNNCKSITTDKVINSNIYCLLDQALNHSDLMLFFVVSRKIKIINVKSFVTYFFPLFIFLYHHGKHSIIRIYHYLIRSLHK